MTVLIISYAFLAFIFLATVWAAIRQIKIMGLFKQGHNPFNRICKKCGAHQSQYQSNIEGCEHNTWWEEVYPIGNDENCQCHKYAEYHN